ncbi:MAG: Gfo/Idh/MocA family oxidoreductase [Verrucomicrobia bacterium]|nr:Gfo/Idh/MocA family oxidoreductase [Verrucomicrobiota bacterium]
MNSNTLNLSRRQFLRYTTLAAGASALSFPYVGRVLGANDRINIACIGVGGKGDSDTNSAYGHGGNIVALCDVDANRVNGKLKYLKDRAAKDNRTVEPKLYSDFRKMFEELDSSIDAVTVSTPDHLHGVACMMAMKRKKHVYCQKPLCQNVSEAREMVRLAKENKLATQMGNQGSANDALRRAVEIIQAGVIGEPKELHVWSNRPVWPQGLDRPETSDPVPDWMNWDCWIGPAQMRPYKTGVYHSFNWRGWYDFGTGALGDMACHMVNMPFRALKLGYANVIECELASRIYPETFPLTSRIRFEFPEREGLPPLKFWWYDGNPGDKRLRPLRPGPEVPGVTKVVDMQGGKLTNQGTLVVGTKGVIFAPDDYAEKIYLALNDEKEFVDGKKHEACLNVPKTIPRSPGHDKEWFDAMKEGKPELAYSRFEIAGYLTESILLGCIALRVGVGKRMEWDGQNMKSTNLPEAAQFVKRQNRAGWEA